MTSGAMVWALVWLVLIGALIWELKRRRPMGEAKPAQEQGRVRE